MATGFSTTWLSFGPFSTLQWSESLDPPWFVQGKFRFLFVGEVILDVYCINYTCILVYTFYVILYIPHPREDVCFTSVDSLTLNQSNSTQIAQKHHLESQHPLYLRSISQIRSHLNLAIHPIAAQLGFP